MMRFARKYITDQESGVRFNIFGSLAGGGLQISKTYRTLTGKRLRGNRPQWIVRWIDDEMLHFALFRRPSEIQRWLEEDTPIQIRSLPIIYVEPEQVVPSDRPRRLRSILQSVPDALSHNIEPVYTVTHPGLDRLVTQYRALKSGLTYATWLSPLGIRQMIHGENWWNTVDWDDPAPSRKTINRVLKLPITERYWVCDGNHRAAARALYDKPIPVVVLTEVSDFSLLTPDSGTSDHNAIEDLQADIPKFSQSNGYIIGGWDEYLSDLDKANYRKNPIPYGEASHGICVDCVQGVVPDHILKSRSEELRAHGITVYCAWCKRIIYDSNTDQIYRR